MNPFKAVAAWWNGFFDKRFWSSTSGGRQTTAREEVSEESSLNFSSVWAATRLLCGTGASLPLPVFRGLDKEEREKERSHPVHRLLNKSPNPEHTAYNFRSLMWQHQVNYGNAFAEIVREGGAMDSPVAELWPIHPERVQVERDEDGDLYYKVRHELTREWLELDAYQILHIPSIITVDGVYGRGVITHARETIGAGIAAEKFASHTFVSGVPRAVVKTAAKWEPETRENFRKEWAEIYGGADKARVALLQGDAELQPFPWSAEDQQFLESRQFGVEEIARWYGVPPHMLQHLLRATFNNVEELGIEFVQYSLIPWLRIWEQCICQKLFTPDEQEVYFAEHNVDALKRGDLESRAGYYQTMTAAALMTRNEVRKLENLPAVDGGDTYLVQGAMVPLDEDGKPESRFAERGNAAEPPPMEEPDDSEDAEMIQGVKQGVKKILTTDLSRMLTKESNAILGYAKKPERFIRLVDTFYGEHQALVSDVVKETVGTLVVCGVSCEQEKFVATWVREAKNIVLEAAGTTNATSLLTTIEATFSSETWTERPARAVERLENATA